MRIPGLCVAFSNREGMYNQADFGNMLTDQVRVKAYHAALEKLAKGRRVLEIGGGTGFFACLASSLGAAHVTSIEQNALITKGPAIARANGLRNIEFVHGSSQHYRCEEQFDLLVHDLRGNTPFFQRSMATLRDAARLLKPGGIFLPSRDRVFAALVEDHEAYRKMEGVWGQKIAGLDLTSVRSGVHRRIRYQRGREARRWPPQLVVEVDYSSPTDRTETVSSFKSDCSGTSHGVVIWFDTVLAEGVGYTTDPWAPDEERGVTYGVVFLPWHKPTEIVQGQEYQLEVSINEKGHVVCRLQRELSGSLMLLGSFVERPETGGPVQLPTDYRFAPHPLVKAYRVALQGIERGERVQSVVRKLQHSCEELRTAEAAYRILSKCVELTQVGARRGRERLTRLRFREHRVSLITNSARLRERALERLAPSWRPTRTKGQSVLEVRLQEVYTESGEACSVCVGGKSHAFFSVEEALRQMELLVLDRAILAGGSYICIEAGYQEVAGAACLRLERGAICLLDENGAVIPYGSAGQVSGRESPLPVRAIETPGGELSPGVLVSLLMQSCRNIRVLPDPLDYFTRLVQGLTSEP